MEMFLAFLQFSFEHGYVATAVLIGTCIWFYRLAEYEKRRGIDYAKNFAEKIEAMIIDNREKNKEFSNLIMQEIKKMHVQFEYEINHHNEFRKIVQEELKEFRHDLHNMETRMATIERK